MWFAVSVQLELFKGGIILVTDPKWDSTEVIYACHGNKFQFKRLFYK